MPTSDTNHGTLLRVRRRGPAVLAACLAFQAAVLPAQDSGAPAPEPASWEWSGVPRVVAVGDVHGDSDKLVRLLTGADLVDASLRWSGGRVHLVLAGDFLDRGSDDRPIMDLLRRLQRESAAAGGRVHVLLGNHEVMNLVRDTRYVSAGSYQDFAPDEEPAARRAALADFVNSLGAERRLESLREFNERFPPGFFARQRSFDADGEYGAWLLELPTIVKVNGVAYVHGGLSEEFAALRTGGINRRVTELLKRHLESRGVLEAASVISPVMGFGEILGAANRALERRGNRLPAALRDAAKGLLEAARSPILGGRGPLWYRGNSFEDERIERDSVERSLALLEAKALVVAHSPTPGHRITSRFQGQLYRIDHGYDQGVGLHALVAEEGEILVLNASTRETTSPMREAPTGRYAARRATELPDDDLQEFLLRSPIVEARDLGRGSTRPQLLVLERNGQTRRGIFKSVDDHGGESAGATDRYHHEVAAYRLDRRLGLGMVPVTVIRKVDGRRGSLQSWIEGGVDRETAEAYEFELYRTPLVVEQLALAEIFDALIGNPDRTSADVLRLIDREQVFLIDHSRAFPTSSELPWDDGETRSVPGELAAALESLDRRSLAGELGGLLSGDQIDALLERRDRILDRVEVAAAAGSSAPR